MDFFQGIQAFLHNQTTKSEYQDWIESLPLRLLGETYRFRQLTYEKLVETFLKKFKKMQN